MKFRRAHLQFEPGAAFCICAAHVECCFARASLNVGAANLESAKFYIGFPPAVAKVRRKGIEYGIGAIPLGGYVKIPGMHRPAPSDANAETR